MKLYALQRDEGYDGDVFIGIYETEEKAKQSLSSEFLKRKELGLRLRKATILKKSY